MSSFSLNGREYEWAVLDSLTLGEASVFQRYSDKTFDRIGFADGVDVDVIRALAHVSIARVEPDETAEAIKKAVDAIPALTMFEMMNAITEEVDEQSIPPPDATRNEGSNSGSGDSSSPTGEHSPGSSSQSDTGSPGSATGVISVPATWGR